MVNQRKKKLKNNRLVYYQATPHSEFWDIHWSDLITPKYYDEYEGGNLDEYEHFFIKYLPKDGLILEAGCGTGKYVLALQKRGYNIEGIEWGSETVKKVLLLHPSLQIKLGDVTSLDVPDSYYDGYISLGVVEHRREGPELFLNEAHRVLRSGGVGLITVPYFNPLRRLKGLLGFFRLNKIESLEFYQYAFSKSEFCKILRETGFNIVETHGLAGYFGLKEEFQPFFTWLDKLPGGWRIKKKIKTLKWIDYFGHVMMFVVAKPN